MKEKVKKMKPLWKRRSFLIIIGCLLVLGIMVGKRKRDATDRVSSDKHTCFVQRSDFLVSILQSGELAATVSREISNEAYSNAKIVEIVEDGSFVTNGQLLVELESSELVDRCLNQKSDVASVESDLIYSQKELDIYTLKHATDLEDATLLVELSELDLKKYLEAEFPQSKLKAESDIMLTEEELKKSRSELAGTQVLFDKGYSNKQDLESEELKVKRNEIEVRNKKTDLRILVDYTDVKTRKKLKNEVAKTKANLERLQQTYSSELLRKKSKLGSIQTRLTIERNQLVTREEQLKKTKVYADFEGQVFYPKERSYRSNETIEKGATINYRQKILSFPDLNSWEIRVGVPEAMIERVMVGQQAVASLDALPGVRLQAVVKQVSAVPDSQGFFSSGVKTYTVLLDVQDWGAVALKPGMSATVEIVSAQRLNVLNVPIQSVLSKENKRYVYVVRRGYKKLREVTTGVYNLTQIEILEGLEEGEELLLYAEVELSTDSQMKKSPLEKKKEITKSEDSKTQ